MRKVGNGKFGHIPFSEPSRTELARSTAAGPHDAAEQEPSSSVGHQAATPTNNEQIARQKLMSALPGSGSTPPNLGQQPTQQSRPVELPPASQTKGPQFQSTNGPLSSPLSPPLNQEDQLYQLLNLKKIPETSITFRDSDLLKGLAPMGQGGFNTVYSLELNDGSGTPRKAVFKPISGTDPGDMLTYTGIDQDNPQIIMRNLATQAYAKKLGFDVIVDTQVAMFTVPTPNENQASAPRLGLLMSPAKGKSGFSASSA